MMSPNTIRQIQMENAAKAAEENKVPYYVEDEDLELWQSQFKTGKLGPLPFPCIGDYVPEGWELEDTLFCDMSGLGEESEPAITQRGLVMDHLKAGKGYAITEAGQFQLYLGVYVKTSQGGLIQ